jgi:mycoredoxin
MSDTTKSDTTTTEQIFFYSTTWCGDCRRSRKIFDAMGVSYTDIDIEQDPTAAELVRSVNHGAQSVPTILFPDGSVLVEPSNAVLEQKLIALGAGKSA